MYAVILAGGGGTRLWPLSRPDRPKPFLPLLAGRTLLRATFDRIVPGLFEPADVFVVTDRRYAALVLEELPELDPAQVLAEPVGRNTAAAIALATVAIERPDTDVMVVLPADHLIAREAVFRGVLRDAAGLADGAFGIEAPLVTLGIAVDRSATEYGYLLPDLERGGEMAGLQAYPLREFEEKPSLARADELRELPGVAWNAGMFIWQRGAIRDALERYTGLPSRLTRAVASPDVLAGAYRALDPVSIDRAVMEPAAAAGDVVMAALDVGWTDLGSWAALRDALAADARAAGEPAGAVGFGTRRDRGSDSTLVMAGDRLVVTIGLRDTIVVDTADALLVCAADRSQEVRAIAEELARAQEGDA